MTSKRRYKYLRALRHILVASLIMMAFYLGRWSMNWRLVDLFATVLYILVVLIYFRSELREHRRDSEEFRRFLRECEENIRREAPPAWNIEGTPLGEAFSKHLDHGYRCPKCGRISHHPEDLKHRYCAACHEFESL